MSGRRAPWVIDIVVFLVFAVVSAAAVIGEPDPQLRPPDPVLAALTIVQLLTLLGWRRYPELSVGVATAAWIAQQILEYGAAGTALIPGVLVFQITAHLPVRRANVVVALASAALLVTTGLAWATSPLVGAVEFGAVVALVAVPYLIGRWWRRLDRDSSGRSVRLSDVALFAYLRERPWIVDGVIFAVLSVLAVLSYTAVPDELDAEFRDPDALLVVLQAVQLVTILTRRAYPVASLSVAIGGWVVERLLVYLPSGGGQLVVPVLLFFIGAELPRSRAERVGWTAVAVVVGFTGLGYAFDPTVSLADFLSVVAIVVIPFLLGRRSHDRAARLELAELRAERAEHEREERAAQAVADERARIARELHDVVAHQMTVMTLQAEGASRLARDLDPRIASALETIRTAGHDALAEMRRMVGLLRTDDGHGLSPQPGLGQLDELVSGMREAGLDVELIVDDVDEPVPDGIALSAFRIVQESLTNAYRHGGPGVSARVAVRRHDDAVHVEVVDDGRGAAAQPSNGHGLVGMRERAALVGGTFEAGPRPGGGYRVAATLPVGSP